MIYFIKDTVTQAVKIGYAKNPKKRLAGLQSATPNPLVLLGQMHGGLGDERAFHEKFAQHRLRGEWFKPDILPQVLRIIAEEVANPQPPLMSVIVSGDSDMRFDRSLGQWIHLQRENAQQIIFRALNEIHTKSPIGEIITSAGNRLVEAFANQWAHQNNVHLYCYYPNWKKYGRYAGFKIGAKMLRSMCDPKLLLVFVADKGKSNMVSLIRQAEKAGIEVVMKHVPVGLPAGVQQPLPANVQQGNGQQNVEVRCNTCGQRLRLPCFNARTELIVTCPICKSKWEGTFVPG